MDDKSTEKTKPALATDLGDMLVEARMIKEEQLRHIRDLQIKNSEKIERILLQERMITPQQLAFFTSLQLRVPFVNVKKEGVHPDAVALVPEPIARRYNVIPVAVHEDTLVMAMEDPRDIEAIEELAALTRKRIEPVVSTSQDIQEMIDLNYRVGGEIEEQLSQIPTRFQKARVAETRVSAEAIAQAPVVRAIDLLLKQAVRDRASDIHIEPQEDRLRIRYRIDGILHEVMTLPLSVHPPLLSRLKIMASLNIAERRRPQDGQITFDMGDRQVDIRVATANTVYGEMVVMRILDKTFALLSLAEIGFLPESLERYMRMVKAPFGMILISGPTGAGKTTTQYATVNTLDAVGRNIMTIEDPVEYRFNNINQLPVSANAGVTFATGLRACMRLDPNVILVGEIRDAETARIGVQASLTGHLVLSSVHANDTASVLFRMIDLGVEAFLLSSALVGITAQRMVRRICPYCTRPTRVKPDEQEAYEKEMHETKTEFLVGSGCSFCANTGYQGRTGIFEVLVMSEAIRRLVLSGAGSDAIRAQAEKEGTMSLWHDGMLKVKMGITTPHEVIRNVYTVG